MTPEELTAAIEWISRAILVLSVMTNVWLAMLTFRLYNHRHKP